MKAFTYERAESPAVAAAAVAAKPGAKFIAGGTNLLDLMKLQIEEPVHLVDVNRLALDKIEPTADGLMVRTHLAEPVDRISDQIRLRPRPGVTAAATTAVFATGDGPGVTALATTAVFATG